MCNVRMIRPEPGLVSIPLEKAVYCENLQDGLVFDPAAVRSLRIGEDRPNGALDPRAVGPRSGSCARIGRIKFRMLSASF